MYSVDHRDRVIPLDDLPQSSAGAPLPVLLRDENSAVIVYFVQAKIATLDTAASLTADEPMAIVTFSPCYAVLHGPPNDETFSSHPLAQRGLHPYRSFEIKDSSWLRRLEEMNRVHPQHDPDRYAARRHFVIAFHDTTFECIALAFKVETVVSSHHVVIARMLRGLLRPDA
jgi:hypothetical protein